MPSALVIYGSETGNAQDAAEELGRTCQRLHFETVVTEMNLIELRHLVQFSIVICVISTTGQGELPVNARLLWKSLLRKKLPPACLARMSFTTFGLGSSSYPKFNWAARKLHKRLSQLGANEFFPRAEADDQHQDGIDTTLLPWIRDLRIHLLAEYPGEEPIPLDKSLPPPFTVQLASDVETAPPNLQDATTAMGSLRLCEQVKGPEPEHSEPAPARAAPLQVETQGTLSALLASNERVTPESHWQDVRLLTFIVPGLEEYQAGDVLTIYPKNFPEDVDKVIDMMGWNDVADKPITYKVSQATTFDQENFIPFVRRLKTTRSPTLRHLLTTTLDITAIPRRSFLEYMAHFTTDEDHRERLQEFTNPAYSDEFYDYTTRPRRSIIEVLEDFPSVKIPWTWAPAIFPLLRGRQYSIASGGMQKRSPTHSDATKIQILVALVKYRTVIKKLRQGVCSRYLAHLALGSRITVDVSRGTFRFTPEEARKPIIMIAPGTGVAPMRSLIWERALMAQTVEGLELGNAYLFFGGRNRKADFFFEKEWELEELRLEVFTAFSRDQRAKFYVQDVIKEKAAVICDALSRGAIIYVCGSSGQMPLAIREAFITVVEGFDLKAGKLLPSDNVSQDEEEKAKRRKAAEHFLEAMDKKGTYIQETW